MKCYGKVIYGVYTCSGGVTGAIQECWYGSTKCNGGNYGSDNRFFVCTNTPKWYGTLNYECNHKINADIDRNALGLPANGGQACSCN